MSLFAESLTWERAAGRFVLSGTIDEHSDFERLAGEIPPDGATLDLGGIRRINSVGVREWMEFLRGVRAPLVLERCAPAFVQQANAIANFCGKARVRSVIASYDCVTCGTTTQTLVDLAAAFPDGRPHVLEAPACTRCGELMELEDEPERYFRFLSVVERA